MPSALPHSPRARGPWHRAPVTDELVWWTPDLPATVAWARRLRFAVEATHDGARIELPPAALSLRARDGDGPDRPGPSDDVLAIRHAGPPVTSAGSGPGRLALHENGVTGLVALGWATVDLERTAVALRPLEAVPAPDEEVLAARAWVAREASGIAGVDLVLLEPLAEGPLAAALARHGEGPVALYLSADLRRAQAVAPALRLREARPSALGRPASLVRPVRAWGPFVLLVGREGQ